MATYNSEDELKLENMMKLTDEIPLKSNGKLLSTLSTFMEKLNESTKCATSEKECVGLPNDDYSNKIDNIKNVSVLVDANVLANSNIIDTQMHNDDEHYEEPTISTENMEIENEADPLCLDNEAIQLECTDEFNVSSDDSSVMDISLLTDSANTECVNATENVQNLSGSDLFKCICDASFNTSFNFRQHLTNCQTEKPIRCAHCTRLFKSVRGILKHYLDHGRERFKCSLCKYQHRHQLSVK